MKARGSRHAHRRVLSDLERKRDSLEQPVGSLEAAVAREAGRSIGPEAVAVAQSATRFLDDRLRRSASGEGPGYLKHSLRVALATLHWELTPSAETLAIALLHNVYEVCRSDETSVVGAGFSQRIASGVRALTVDRGREEDLDYLVAFYAGIERAGTGVALVRCVDRIDNLLGYDSSRGERTRLRYVDVSERFVLPIAYRCSEFLGRYFEAVIEYARSG